MRKYIFAFFFYQNCFAQQPDSISRVKFPHLTSYTEAGGNAIFYSQNVEYFISNNRTVNFNIRAGIGFIDSDEFFAPFLVNSIIGRKKSKLELGIGVLFSGELNLTTTIAYRHQANNGLFYRLAFTPHYNTRFSDSKFIPWGGLSLGYYFGYKKTKEEVKPILNLDSADNKLNLIIKTDLFLSSLSLVYKSGYAALTIEKGFKRRHSVQLTGIYGYSGRNYSYSDTTFRNNKNNMFQIIPEYKYFTGKRRYYTGFYVGAFIKYIYNNKKVVWRNLSSYPYILTNSLIDNTVSAGLIIGYQNYIFKRRVVIDILAGFGYGYEWRKQGTHTSKFYEVPDGRLAVNLGYRF